MEENEIIKEEIKETKEKEKETETREPDDKQKRLEMLAQKRGVTVEEYLWELEKSLITKEEIVSAQNRSTGSQTKNESMGFDPTGTEFVKGIWGKN